MNKATVPSDSVADGIESPTQCPNCGTLTRLDHGTCINCLLHEGLETRGEASREAFESVLVEANVTDTEWRLGHYEILEEIGRGGMGVIYRARQQHSRRIVAVKRILAHQVNSHETLVRFRREAEAVASLDHPNILPIYEVSESEESLPFFSMKYATGGSLRTAAPSLRAKPRECVRLMAKVARAIAYAHSKGVLHRDLQPGNILLDENGEPMVSDFGLAKWLNETSDLTRTLETLGTPGYIAPEQAECRAGDLTSAADVYSLGAILFYLLSGRPPFVGPNVLHVIHQAAATSAPRLRSLIPSLDRDLETIVVRCLESDPNARYQCAGALADDLDHWLRHEPIRARRVGPFTRTQKWVRRNPTTTLLTAALVVLAAVIVGVVVWKNESPHPISSLPAGIAVLPFENLSGDPDNAYFADGIQEEILNHLTKIADLKVISRPSVMQYKAGAKRDLRQVANDLGVTHVVEGSVQRAGNRVRVSTQLTDTRTNKHLWVEHYDRPLEDVFRIESDIAHAIAAQLQAKLSPKEKAVIEERPTSDLAAYDLYLKAKELRYNARFNPARREKALFKAVELLNEAVTRDPAFLLAHCQLASANDQIYFSNYDHTQTRLTLAESSVEAAVRLQPDAGETHLARANHFFWGYLDYRRAREELANAQHELPNNAEVFKLLGGIGRWEGRWEEARQNLERAVELDPRNSSTITDLAWVYMTLRKYEEADALATRLQALEPRSPILRAGRAFIGLEARADMTSLRAVLNTIESESWQSATEVADLSFRLARYERDPTKAARALANMPRQGKIDMNYVPFPHTWYEGLLAKLRHDATAAHSAFTTAHAETEKLVHAQPQNVRPLAVLALIDAELGDKEKAIREGRIACDMLPPTKDALDGVWLMTNLARIYALTGEKDLALEQLEAVMRLASGPINGPSYGDMHLNPEWDPMRGDPRFEKLVEESKKPVALESSRPLPAGIAVLPLQNLSEETENAYFADGIQDELLTNLSKIRDLKVISRTSVTQYKSGITRNLQEIAQQLGVSNVVEGSVRRSGNHVRVSMQLIDAKTNRHLWAQNYDRTLADSVALQGDLATEIAAAVGGTLSPQEKARVQAKPTKNAAAYDAYLRGRAFAARSYQKSYEENAIQSYQDAVRLDPNFALAWARLSIAVGHNPWDPTPARLASVKDAADHALALDPDLPETHLAVGYYRYGQHDYTEALAEFQQAEQGLPNNAEVIEAIALVQRRLGHWEEAITGLRRTIELDPRYHDAYENLAGTYRWLRRFPETLATVNQLLAWEPNDVIALGRKAAALWAMGDLQAVEPLLTNPGFDSYDRGVQALFQRRYAAAIEIFSAPPPSNPAPHPSTSERDLFLGLSQQRAGDIAAARRTYQKAVQDFQRQLEKVVPDSWHEAWLRTCLGRAHAGLGDAASAIAEGEKAMAIDPASKNPVDGPGWEEKLANIYALLADADHAIPILKRLLRTTYAGAITPALLRLDPVWDQIRNDPRFQELATEGKPIPEKGIAVLPFENLSADADNAFFTVGVQDEILNDLAKIADLKVISRTSVMQYKSGAKRNLRQIGNELGVAHVVEGSVQRAANRVRVSAQLIDAKTDAHLWAESYDRPADDVFAIQSEIAKSIATQLHAKLSPSQSSALATVPTHDMEAYDLFLRGESTDWQSPDRAATFYQQALARDPNFALAYARLAYSRLQRHWYISPLTAAQLAEVKSNIDRALTLAPDSPDSHLAAAEFYYRGHRDYDAALTELDRTVELQPNNARAIFWRGVIYRRRGEWRRSLAEFERAVELNPRDSSSYSEIGCNLLEFRRWSDAERALTHALALDPHNTLSALYLANTYINSTGDIRRARQAWEEVPADKKMPIGTFGASIGTMIESRVYLDVLERHFADALKAWDIAPTNIPDAEARLRQLDARVGIHVLAGQNAAARPECEQTRALLEAKLAEGAAEDRTALTALAWVYICLGRNADALRVARQAADSLPIERDALSGPSLLVGLAQIEAHAGRPEEAIKILRQLLVFPAGVEISIARLKIDPVWDPIRNDPGFQKLLSEPEPETVYN